MIGSEHERHASFYRSETGRVNEASVVHACARLNMELIDRLGGSSSALFLGLGEGGLLEMMADRFARSVAVEASATLVSDATKRFSHVPSLTVVRALFETYELPPGQEVHWLLGNHVLEHLDDPVQLLRRSHRWLAPDGRAVFTVPNATSLHRRIGVAMSLLPDVHALSPQDERVGHKRVYDLASLKADLAHGGYEVLETGGFNVKLVSQAQMRDWPPELHDAIYQVSRSCPPELCSNLYAVGRSCKS